MGNPTFLYRAGKNGEVESKIFDSDDLPDGWVDSPAAIKQKPRARESASTESVPELETGTGNDAEAEADQVVAEPAAKRRGRPPKAQDND